MKKRLIALTTAIAATNGLRNCAAVSHDPVVEPLAYQ
jgi:hypothetical protein